ncbi:transformer-SR ribonucleoprotein/RNA recognition motif containing protein [Golovinomyces cichoracearum]|uniref:Transformer-SR ribonucleoprotein/RNA recognition motif containing protein n=1 Tax=Golovinomyces cichoracearum TaxID=62708 RepID=A0A420INV3_9PEZI|nr:transformer-SR ribonucleoprotein/RNA recognition motif containing protein [Golovinomyces cichoracearum]
MASMDYENENGARYEEDNSRYEHDRSASPRPTRRNESPRDRPRRSASPIGNGHADIRGPPKGDSRGASQDDGAINPGSNLFVTGIHPRLSEQDVTRLFEKYGDVEKCQIMLDPHTKESRGFGFVKMVTADQADAAKEGLQGEVIEGRTLSIEKARRSRPRTPTPGKYHGPPKRGKFYIITTFKLRHLAKLFSEDPRHGGRYNDRYDDRRRGGYGGRDDYRGGGGYRRDDRDRGYGGRDRDDYAPRGGDRYARDDRYGGRGNDDRRGGAVYSDRYDRGDRGAGRDAPSVAAYGDPAPRGEGREPYGGGDRRSRKFRQDIA